MDKEKGILHHYIDDAERFADLYNVVFFEGRKMIDAKALREAKPQHFNQRETEAKEE